MPLTGRVRAALNKTLGASGRPLLSGDFVLHSLRHTMLSRLGEAGADAFTIMKIAGHSTVVVSQRYIHPTPEAVGRAFERLEALNREAGLGLPPATEADYSVPVPANFPTAVSAGETAIH